MDTLTLRHSVLVGIARQISTKDSPPHAPTGNVNLTKTHAKYPILLECPQIFDFCRKSPHTSRLQMRAQFYAMAVSPLSPLHRKVDRGLDALN